jgi:hypothetical protein
MTNDLMMIAYAACQRGEKFTKVVDPIFSYPTSPGELPEALWNSAYCNDPPHAIAAGGHIDVRRSSKAVKTASSAFVSVSRPAAPIQLNLGSSGSNNAMPQTIQDFMANSFQQMFQQQIKTMMQNMMGGMGGMGGMDFSGSGGGIGVMHGLGNPVRVMVVAVQCHQV